jgi:hypothetical protein
VAIHPVAFASPVLLTGTGLLRTSRQITDHLLCWDCEQRFSQNGEDWVSRHAYNGERFLLLDILRASDPVWPGYQNFGVYSGAAIEAIDMDKLVYFAFKRLLARFGS